MSEQLNVFEQARIVDTWRNPNRTNIDKVEDLCLQFSEFAKRDPLTFHFAMNLRTEKLNELVQGKIEVDSKLAKDFAKLNEKEMVKEILEERISSEKELKDFCKKDLTYLSKFPTLVKTAVEYEHFKLEEFLQVSKTMLSKIRQVQKGEIDIHQCSDAILQGDLAQRFYKKK